MADQAQIQAQVVAAQVQQLHQPLLQGQGRVGSQPVEVAQGLALTLQAVLHGLVVLLLTLGVQQLPERSLQRRKEGTQFRVQRLLAAGQGQHTALTTGKHQRQGQRARLAPVRVGCQLLGMCLAQYPQQHGLQGVWQGRRDAAAKELQLQVALVVGLGLEKIDAGKVCQLENLLQQLLQGGSKVVLLDIVRLRAADDFQQLAIALAALTLRADGLGMPGHLPPGGVATVEQQQGEQGDSDQPAQQPFTGLAQQGAAVGGVGVAEIFPGQQRHVIAADGFVRSVRVAWLQGRQPYAVVVDEQLRPLGAVQCLNGQARHAQISRAMAVGQQPAAGLYGLQCAGQLVFGAYQQCQRQFVVAMVMGEYRKADLQCGDHAAVAGLAGKYRDDGALTGALGVERQAVDSLAMALSMLQ